MKRSEFMDFQRYGGYPIRLKQAVNDIKLRGRMSDREFQVINESADVLKSILDEAQDMKEQLKAHDALWEGIGSFANDVGIGVGSPKRDAQYVPTKDVDPIRDLSMGVVKGLQENEDKEWLKREDKSTWPFLDSDMEKAYSHTSFMKLSERVNELEKKLLRATGFSPGRL